MRVPPTHVMCVESVLWMRLFLQKLPVGYVVWKSEADIKFEQSCCNLFSWRFLSFMSWAINIRKLLQILVSGYNWELHKVLYNCYSLLVGRRWQQWRNCCSTWWTPSSVSCWVWSIPIGTSDTLTTRSSLTPDWGRNAHVRYHEESLFIVRCSVWEFSNRGQSRIYWKYTLKEVFNFNDLLLKYTWCTWCVRSWLHCFQVMGCRYTDSLCYYCVY
jgi:hypothetical protein